MKFSVFQDSHPGGRKRNEDSMGYCYTSDAALLVVADGMGGHPEGEVASYLTLKVLVDRFRAQATPRLSDVGLFLEESLLAANQTLVDYARAHGLLDSPRTTVVAAVIQDDRLSWVHCGDSRLYLIRQGVVLARTVDHSLVERDRQLGGVGADAFPGNRNALYTCIGSVGRPIFDLAGPVALRGQDSVVLCTDGLWSVVPDEVLVQELVSLSVEEAVPRLLTKARKLGGAHGDNVTCLALTWDEQGDFVATSRTVLSMPPGGQPGASAA
jgi:serine/threonine protein phosphatase PrpC